MSHSLAWAWDGARVLSRLHAAERMAPAAVSGIQLERVRRLIRVARRAPHYDTAFRAAGIDDSGPREWEDFARIEPLRRETVRDDASRLRAPGAGDVPASRVRTVCTTGSSGTPLRLEATGRELRREWLLIAYAFLKSGGRPGDAYAHIHVHDVPRAPTWIERLGIFRQLSLDLRDGAEPVARGLRRTRPAVLYSYPSFLALLAREVLAASPLGYIPRRVITHGEILGPETRALLERAFGCPVRDTYGCAECFRIAFECGSGRLHVIPEAAVVEFDPDTRGDDGSFEVLLTSLIRTRMPLIRYRLGDRAVPAAGPCPCGCPFPSLQSVAGRIDDLLVLPGGRALSARAINVFEDLPGVAEYQVVQKRSDRFEVVVRPAGGFNREVEERIRSIIARGCAPDAVEVEVRLVDSIPRAASGKRRAVISEVVRPR